MMRRFTTTAFIALAAIALVACSSSSGSAAPTAAASQAGSPAAPAGGPSAVSIKDFAFNPATTTVPTGSKVTWTNNDTTAHTVTFDDGSADSGNLAPAAPFDQTFTTAGTFAYHCKIHSQMKGTVTVTP